MKDRFGFDWSGVAGTNFWKGPHVSRRVFFRHLGSAVGGYYLMPSRPMETVAKAAVSTRNTARNCIFILLAGAPSHVDTFDLKEGPWTPARFNATSYGPLRFPQALLPNTAAQLDSLALVRSVRSWAAVHGLAQTWLQIGRNPASALAKIAPHIGSVASIELGASSSDRTLPAFLALNGTPAAGSGYLPAAHSPFTLAPNGGGLANTAHRDGQPRFESRFNMLQAMDAAPRAVDDRGPLPAEMVQWNADARKLMYNSRVDAIFSFPQEERVRYGNSAFGNACITARNLIRSRMGARFVQITLGGWDHHVDIYNPNAQLTPLARTFDNAFGPLLADLKSGGLLDETLVVVLGEFGRTVGDLNNTGGRDHHLQQTAIFAGAGIRGGRAIGSTDAQGLNTDDPGWSRQRDVRAEDLEATIYSALGIDWTIVRKDDPLGRGFEYVPFSDRDLYGPLDELWA